MILGKDSVTNHLVVHPFCRRHVGDYLLCTRIQTAVAINARRELAGVGMRHLMIHYGLSQGIKIILAIAS